MKTKDEFKKIIKEKLKKRRDNKKTYYYHKPCYDELFFQGIESFNNIGIEMSKDIKSNYYDEGGIEVLDIIKAKLTTEQYKGYLLGNALKYQCRLNFKGCSDAEKLRDAEKAANYTAWLRDIMMEQTQ